MQYAIPQRYAHNHAYASQAAAAAVLLHVSLHAAVLPVVYSPHQTQLSGHQAVAHYNTVPHMQAQANQVWLTSCQHHTQKRHADKAAVQNAATAAWHCSAQR
jgi:hypothetical protein